LELKKASSIVAPFLEQFIEGDRWISSQAKKIVDGVEDEDLLQYRGEWKVEPGTEELIEGDKGLVLKTLAAHSVLCTNLGYFC
jgi:calnexin